METIPSTKGTTSKGKACLPMISCSLFFLCFAWGSMVTIDILWYEYFMETNMLNIKKKFWHLHNKIILTISSAFLNVKFPDVFVVTFSYLLAKCLVTSPPSIAVHKIRYRSHNEKCKQAISLCGFRSSTEQWWKTSATFHYTSWLMGILNNGLARSL